MQNMQKNTVINKFTIPIVAVNIDTGIATWSLSNAYG